MSSKANKTPGRKPQLTEKENEFIKAMFDNMTQRPDADWDKVADDLGLANAKCAKERFRQMSKKHGWGSGPDASPVAKSKVSKPATNSVRKGRKRQAKSKTSYMEIFSDSADSNGEPDIAKITESDDDNRANIDFAREAETSQMTPTKKRNAALADPHEHLPLPNLPNDTNKLVPYDESELDEDDIARWADEF
ncbi:hypothetical protein ACRALDRAFT_1067572 [Sodiomyces alcalophilus JCM 7366]|uniref:uncharacterized protein n=1 Tax=Sodiomyces alcalophilus JCM 7366 TaxID=591952 RepID=UPI0039B62EC3